MTCRTGCPEPGAHSSWGACARASRIQIGDLQAEVQKRWDRELGAYQDARRQGVQPSGTSLAQTQAAMELSERTGTAFNATTALG